MDHKQKRQLNRQLFAESIWKIDRLSMYLSNILSSILVFFLVIDFFNNLLKVILFVQKLVLELLKK
jgi:hypothetical protein